MVNYILVINPGSTSTKFAIFEDEKPILKKVIYHSAQALGSYESIMLQSDARKRLIINSIHESEFDSKKLTCVCGRGGLLRPLVGGTYKINEKMLDDLKSSKYGSHASNLGAIIAHEIASYLNIPAYTVDPVSIDELEDIARISGMPLIERTSIFHALNHKAIARHVASDKGKKYDEMNLIIAHLGGGISVAAHHKGQVIDVNGALDGDGPMSPERSGSVPIGPLTKLCFSNKYTLDEVIKMNHGEGGLVGYLNSNNAKEIVERINNGDKYAKLIYDAMIYQTAKEIGAYATVLKGQIDYIALTGGLAYEEYFIKHLKERISFLAEILVYPGEDELLSLALGALRVQRNVEQSKDY